MRTCGGRVFFGHASARWGTVLTRSTEPPTKAEAQAAAQAEGGREPLEPEGPLSLQGSIFFPQSDHHIDSYRGLCASVTSPTHAEK